VAKTPMGFVSLKSLKQGAPDPTAALGEIRRIYFKTTARTIEHDIAHAIELLKSLPTDEDRERAAVFMQGLNEMRNEWERVQSRKRRRSGKNAAGSTSRPKSKAGQ